MKCAACDIELTATPTIAHGEAFCCRGCMDGGPCTCSYEGDLTPRARNGRGRAPTLKDLLDRYGDAADRR